MKSSLTLSVIVNPLPQQRSLDHGFRSVRAQPRDAVPAVSSGQARALDQTAPSLMPAVRTGNDTPAGESVIACQPGQGPLSRLPLQVTTHALARPPMLWLGY
jgi:hypothetical protein